MDAYLQWLLAASGVILLAGWLGYRAFQRAAGKRKTARKEAEAAARVEVLRRAGEEAARRRVAQEAAAREAAAAARGVAEQAAQRAERAERAARAEAARQVAADAAAREAAAAAARAQAAAKAHAQAAARAAEQARALARALADAQGLAQADRLAAQAALRLEAEEQGRAAALAAAESVRPGPPAAGAPVKAPDQTLVMVADDSKVVRVKTGRLLAQHQYRVSYAIDGLDAARQMQTCIPDIVVTDIEMPGMDGFELTRHVRQNPLTAHIPIIMITAADDKHRDNAQRAGVTVLLGKPYPEDALIAHIRLAMGVGVGVGQLPAA